VDTIDGHVAVALDAHVFGENRSKGQVSLRARKAYLARVLADLAI